MRTLNGMLLLTICLSALCATDVAALNPAPVPAASSTTIPTVSDGTRIEAASEPASHSINVADLSAYVDGIIEGAMERDGIAGVTVAIVDRNGPLLLRGYGIAGQSPERMVDPRKTLFRIASISKTFTYLLGLKLIDAGRLDLDAPVNNYLPPDLRLPDDGFAPVLVRHLFTHGAGFEDSAMGHLFVDRAGDVLSIHDYLLRHRPARVREPGIHAVYSNYSVVLLGALIAEVEGKDFDTLVERDLFGPMGMLHTTFREPLTKDDLRNVSSDLKGLWSEGFDRTGGRFKPQAFEHIAQIGPAGGASSTAEDMSRYMRMLLNGGTLDGVEVLTPSAHARLMAGPLFRNAPSAGGFSYGFFDLNIGKMRAIGHGGTTSWFHSGMVVAPEPGLGVFVSTNTGTGHVLAQLLPFKVFERYAPDSRGGPEPSIPKGFDAKPYAGTYASERGNFTTAEKIFMTATLSVAAAEDNSIVVTSGDQSRRYIPLGNRVFREAEGTLSLAFFEDGKGRITGFASRMGDNVYDRVGPLQDAKTLLALMGVLLVTALFVLNGAWLRRRRVVNQQVAARLSARWLYVTAKGWLVYLIVVAVYVGMTFNDLTAAFYRYPEPLFKAALWIALPVMILSAGGVALLWPAWRARDWGFWRKMRHTSAVALFAFGAWLLWSWNLVPWKL